jgi:hypothetical protein
MKTRKRIPLTTLAVLLCLWPALTRAQLGVRYVDVNCASPTPPYTNWATAAVTIQDAVDAAVAGEAIVVTNGTYATGGRALYGTMTNRVAVEKPLTVRSVNGPEVTVIQGCQAPGGGTGSGAIRCVYLANGATLSGFTLTNGTTCVTGDFFQEQSAGGVWCESATAVLSNCVICGNHARERGGGACSGTLNNCTVTANSADYYGGGAYESTLNNCTVTGNTVNGYGGGVWNCTLNNCTLTTNSAVWGGGAAGGTLNSCTLSGNSATQEGGGADGGTLNNCTLTGNSSVNYGGGAYSSLLNNCTVNGNSASSGGGACGGTLNNCRLTRNRLVNVGYYSQASGGGASQSTLNNCIVYGNGYDNYAGGTLSYCCTTPMPTNGVGNITNEPAFVNSTAGDFHLRYGSPCIDAGTDLSAILTNDLDGRPRPLDGNGDGIAAFDIGAYEFVPPACYVWPESPNPSPPFSTWATAAHTIQEAVDAAQPGDTVLVTNGTYATGGRAVFSTMTNRVAVDKPLTLRSVNGPQFTVIQGYQVPGTTNGEGAIRCVYLTNGASLLGFTLTNGATHLVDIDPLYRFVSCGGGLWCESTNAFAANCVVKANSALYGGGAAYGTLDYCTLTGNSAASGGGGAAASPTGPCTLHNCIVYFNTAPSGSNWYRASLNYCCTTPMPTNGVGNITSEPAFVDWPNGNLRLQPNSPCINAGNNAYATDSTGLDGNPRIVSGTVDIGAYEYQGAGSVISYAWLQQFGLPTDGSADTADPDADGLNTWQEWRCLTDPTNTLSVLRLASATPDGTNVTVTWQSVAGVNYFLERSTNLSASPRFTCLATNLPGQTNTISFTDTNAASPTPLFYRVGVP